MEEAYTIVIKVKYGDVLRRFSSWIFDSELGVNVDELKEKILSLFKLPQNSALTLTYIDEDDDEVMLVDDDDLRDIVRQKLDLLRITVKLTAVNNATKYFSSGSFTPLKSPPVQKLFQCTKTALEPLCETLVKLSTNLAPKTSTSTPDIKSLVNYFSEVSSSCLAYISEFQPRMQTPTDNFVMKDSETSKADAAQSMVRSNVGFEGFIKQNESMEKLELLATVIDNSVKLGDKSVVSIKTSSATGPGLNDVGLDSKTINAGWPVRDSLQCSGPASKSRVVGKKEKFEQISECFSKDKSSLRSSHCLSVVNKDWFSGMSDVSSNVPVKNATSPKPELDLVNPSSKKNASASPSRPARSAVKLSRKDDLSKSCRQDYFCDGSGADPIFGPRFRSKVKEDYDLCILCFSRKENDSDYIRMDRSDDVHHQVLD